MTSEARLYLRDCADHCVQQMDMVEIYREVAQGLVDLHLSSVSNKMNEVMKVLTVISTIFMPMTFIAGVYGMNFDTASPWNLPELHWYFGYPIALAAMALSGLTMVGLFWRAGWVRPRLPWRRAP
jgi:magnesium transporter